MYGSKYSKSKSGWSFIRRPSVAGTKSRPSARVSEKFATGKGYVECTEGDWEDNSWSSSSDAASIWSSSLCGFGSTASERRSFLDGLPEAPKKLCKVRLLDMVDGRKAIFQTFERLFTTSSPNANGANHSRQYVTHARD